VTFVERRKGDSQRTLDRRRTYIDVVERVLRSALPVESRSANHFRRFEIGHNATGSTISSVEIDLLADLDGIPHH
jgi:hypothetical protein